MMHYTSVNLHQVQMRAAGQKQDAGLLQTVDDDLSSDDDNIEVKHT
jgi:hypothetical protein